MKKCPQCGQMCSDMINECTKCHHVFFVPQDVQSLNNQQNSNQQGGYQQNCQMSGYQQNVQTNSASMSFGEAISSCFNQFSNFKGRARRSEFWFFYLFYTIVSLVFTALGSVSEIFAVIGFLSEIALFIPWLACSVRRLHDIGRSGTEMWWMLCPIYGIIRMLIFWTKDSNPDLNFYGPCPQ